MTDFAVRIAFANDESRFHDYDRLVAARPPLSVERPAHYVWETDTQGSFPASSGMALDDLSAAF
jgi:hypothetical protein